MAPDTEAMGPTYQLYSYSSSSCAARIIIACNLLRIHLELSPVNMNAGEHNSESFRLLNPSLAIPVLVVRLPNGQETKITQSIAILEYLVEISSSTANASLLPSISRTLDRAKVRELVGIIASDIFPPVNGRIAKKVRAIRGEVSDQIKWVHEAMATGFSSYESMLKDCAGTYSFGDNVSMADVVLVPMYDMGIGYKVDLSPYLTVARVYKALSLLEAFQKPNWAV